MKPKEILDWVKEMRKMSNGAFQLNTWIPDPEPVRNKSHEKTLSPFVLFGNSFL